ncbi:MAG: hypothetical protein KDA58_02125 [Planctomycetaceae bacterium]|nr:hypothetical protein [Planctomycetaceae bacterium]
MLTFAPTLVRDTTQFELPRPILSLRIRDDWDLERNKVPLRRGELHSGQSQNGVDILITGQIGTQSGQLRIHEQEMFETLTQLRNQLDTTTPTGTFRLSLYHDGLGQHHYFDLCTTMKFEADLSDKHLFDFSIQIRAADPIIHFGPL